MRHAAAEGDKAGSVILLRAEAHSGEEPATANGEGARPPRPVSSLTAPPSSASHKATTARISPSSASGASASATTPGESSWLQTTCYAALFTLVELFHRFQVSVNFLLPELLSLIASCIDGESDDLARIGLKCLVVLCQTCGPQLSVQSWWLVLDAVMDVLRRLQPQQLQSNDTRILLGLPPVSMQAVQAAVRKGSRGQPELIAQALVTTDLEASPAPPAQTLATVTAPAAAPATNAVAPTGEGAASVVSAAAGEAQPVPASAAADATSDVVTAPPTAVNPAAPAAAAGASPPAVSLPFTSASVGVRSRTSLLLMDALYEVVLRYFPQRPREADPLPPLAPSLSVQFPAHVDPFHSPTHTAESVAAERTAGGRFTYDATADNAADESGESTASSLSPPLGVKRPIDRRVLGCLTCAQLFFALDILHSSVVFSHRFNADLALRRRLFNAGLILFEQSNRLPQLFAAEAHALKVSVLLLAQLYKAGLPHEAGRTAESQRPPSFLREDDSAPSLPSTQTSNASSVPHLSVSASALSPSSSAESAAALRSRDVSDFDCSAWEAERRLFALISAVLSVYLSKVRSGQLSAVESSDEVCVAFIEQFATLPAAPFFAHLQEVWQPIVDLIESAQTPPLRAAVRRFMMSAQISGRVKGATE